MQALEFFLIMFFLFWCEGLPVICRQSLKSSQLKCMCSEPLITLALQAVVSAEAPNPDVEVQ